MNKKLTLFAGCTLALMLLAGPSLRADYYYIFNPVGNPTVYSDHAGMGLTLSDQPSIGPIASGANTNVVATADDHLHQPGCERNRYLHGQDRHLELDDRRRHRTRRRRSNLTFNGSLSAKTSRINVGFSGSDTADLTVNGHTFHVVLDKHRSSGYSHGDSGQCRRDHHRRTDGRKQQHSRALDHGPVLPGHLSLIGSGPLAETPPRPVRSLFLKGRQECLPY